MKPGGARWACIVAATVLMLTVAGCAARGSESAVLHSPGSDIYDVPGDDSTMNAAIARAQATLDRFAAVLAAPRTKQRDFALKVKLTDGTNFEHVWLADPIVTETKVSGDINNDIERVSGYELGQHVTFGRDRVSDWMYVDHGVLQGGFTIRVLRDQMSSSERAEFDKSVPFKVQ